MKIDDKAIRKLAELLDETGLTEIEVAEGDQMIRVNRGGGTVAGAAPMAAPAAAAAAPVVANAADHPGAVLSPMVGTAYAAAEPGAPPFVKKGDSVAEGDTLVIIEAMKVMNPIKAHKAGTVTEIHFANAQPVEYGDVLVIIE